MTVAALAALALIPLADSGSGIPVWLSAGIVVATGVVATFTSAWFGLRPVEPGQWRLYQGNAIFRSALGLDPTIIASILALVAGPWWLIPIGVTISVFSLARSVPGSDDYERHQRIWLDRHAMPATDVWGTADPEAIPPWEDPEGGHGHGLHDH